MRTFTCVILAIHDPQLILEVRSLVDRRALLMAIKSCRTNVQAHLHLTPQGKANKSLVYFTSRRFPVGLEDRGDIVYINWHTRPSVNIRLDITRSAAEVE